MARTPKLKPNGTQYQFELGATPAKCCNTQAPSAYAETAAVMSARSRMPVRLTFDMSGGLTGAKRRARRPLDGRVRRHSTLNTMSCCTRTRVGLPPRRGGSKRHRKIEANVIATNGGGGDPMTLGLLTDPSGSTVNC